MVAGVASAGVGMAVGPGLGYIFMVCGVILVAAWFLTIDYFKGRN